MGGMKDLGIFVVAKDMMGKGVIETANALHIDSHGTVGNDTGDGVSAMGEIEVRKRGKGGRQSGKTALHGGSEGERGLAVLANGEGGLLCNAIDLLQSLTQEQVGEGTFFPSLLVLEAQCFLPSPLGQGGDGTVELLGGDGVEVVADV